MEDHSDCFQYPNNVLELVVTAHECIYKFQYELIENV